MTNESNACVFCANALSLLLQAFQSVHHTLAESERRGREVDPQLTPYSDLLLACMAECMYLIGNLTGLAFSWRVAPVLFPSSAHLPSAVSPYPHVPLPLALPGLFSEGTWPEVPVRTRSLGPVTLCAHGMGVVGQGADGHSRGWDGWDVSSDLEREASIVDRRDVVGVFLRTGLIDVFLQVADTVTALQCGTEGRPIPPYARCVCLHTLGSLVSLDRYQLRSSISPMDRSGCGLSFSSLLRLLETGGERDGSTDHSVEGMSGDMLGESYIGPVDKSCVLEICREITVNPPIQYLEAIAEADLFHHVGVTLCTLALTHCGVQTPRDPGPNWGCSAVGEGPLYTITQAMYSYIVGGVADSQNWDDGYRRLETVTLPPASNLGVYTFRSLVRPGSAIYPPPEPYHHYSDDMRTLCASIIAILVAQRPPPSSKGTSLPAFVLSKRRSYQQTLPPVSAGLRAKDAFTAASSPVRYAQFVNVPDWTWDELSRDASLSSPLPPFNASEMLLPDLVAQALGKAGGFMGPRLVMVQSALVAARTKGELLFPASQASEDDSSIQRHMVRVVMEMFGSEVPPAVATLRETSTALQHLTIDILTALVVRDPTSLTSLLHVGVLSLMLSDQFLFWGQTPLLQSETWYRSGRRPREYHSHSRSVSESGSELEEDMGGDGEVCVEAGRLCGYGTVDPSFESFSGQVPIVHYAAPAVSVVLRHRLMAFLSFCMSVSDICTKDILSALLSVANNVPNRYATVFVVLDCILSVVRISGDVLSALADLRPFKLLVGTLVHVQGSIRNVTDPVLLVQLRQLRHVVLSLLDHLMSIESASLHCLYDDDVVQVVFGLILDPELRDWVLSVGKRMFHAGAAHPSGSVPDTVLQGDKDQAEHHHETSTPVGQRLRHVAAYYCDCVPKLCVRGEAGDVEGAVSFMLEIESVCDVTQDSANVGTRLGDTEIHMRRSRIQQAFTDVDVFVKLWTGIQSACCDLSMIRAMLRAVRSLVTGSIPAKAAFAQDVLDEHLADLIVQGGGGWLRVELVILLFDILVETDFNPACCGQYHIQNQSVLRLLFLLVRHKGTRPWVQHFIVDCLCFLVEASVSNKLRMASAGSLEDIIASLQFMDANYTHYEACYTTAPPHVSLLSCSADSLPAQDPVVLRGDTPTAADTGFGLNLADMVPFATARPEWTQVRLETLGLAGVGPEGEEWPLDASNPDLMSNSCCGHHVILLIRRLAYLGGIVGLRRVQELKSLFSLLRSQPDGHRSPYIPLVLRVLQRISRGTTPGFVLDSDGCHSGVRLPPFALGVGGQWGRQGFSVSLWLRIESFDDPQDKPMYRPRIISMLDHKGHGFEFYIAQGLLVYRVCSADIDETHYVTKDELCRGIWRHMCIVVVPSHTQRGCSQVDITFYEDASVLGSLKGVPFVPDGLVVEYDKACVGSNIPQHKKRVSSLVGQVAGILLLNRAVSERQVRSMRDLGTAGVAQALALCTTVRTDMELASDLGLQSHISRDHRPVATGLDFITGSVVLCILAEAAVSETEVLDLTPGVEEGRGIAHLYSGTRVVGSRTIKELLPCVGGAVALLPLIRQFGRPIPPRFDSPCQVSERVGSLGTDSRMVSTVYELVHSLLQSSQSLRAEFESLGLSLLAGMLETCNPGFIGPDVVTQLDLLVATFSKARAGSTPLLREVLVTHVYNLELWLWCSKPTQDAVLSLYHSLVNPRRGMQGIVQQVVTLPRVLDMMALCMWYSPMPRAVPKQMCSAVPSHSRQVRDGRPGRDRLLFCRASILKSLVKWYAGDTSKGRAGPSSPRASEGRSRPMHRTTLRVTELRSLLGHILDTPGDDQARAEMMLLLLLLLKGHHFNVSHLGGAMAVCALTKEQYSLGHTHVRPISLLRGTPQPSRGPSPWLSHLPSRYSRVETPLLCALLPFLHLIDPSPPADVATVRAETVADSVSPLMLYLGVHTLLEMLSAVPWESHGPDVDYAVQRLVESICAHPRSSHIDMLFRAALGVLPVPAFETDNLCDDLDIGMALDVAAVDAETRQMGIPLVVVHAVPLKVLTGVLLGRTLDRKDILRALFTLLYLVRLSHDNIQCFVETHPFIDLCQVLTRVLVPYDPSDPTDVSIMATVVCLLGEVVVCTVEQGNSMVATLSELATSQSAPSLPASIDIMRLVVLYALSRFSSMPEASIGVAVVAELLQLSETATSHIGGTELVGDLMEGGTILDALCPASDLTLCAYPACESFVPLHIFLHVMGDACLFPFDTHRDKASGEREEREASQAGADGSVSILYAVRRASAVFSVRSLAALRFLDAPQVRSDVALKIGSAAQKGREPNTPPHPLAEDLAKRGPPALFSVVLRQGHAVLSMLDEAPAHVWLKAVLRMLAIPHVSHSPDPFEDFPEPPRLRPQLKGAEAQLLMQFFACMASATLWLPESVSSDYPVYASTLGHCIYSVLCHHAKTLTLLCSEVGGVPLVRQAGRVLALRASCCPDSLLANLRSGEWPSLLLKMQRVYVLDVQEAAAHDTGAAWEAYRNAVLAKRKQRLMEYDSLAEQVAKMSITHVMGLLLKERERRTQLRAELLSHRRAARSQTRTILSDLTNSRGAWCQGEQNSATRVFWRLFNSEDDNRRRCRMIRYPGGTDHSDDQHKVECCASGSNDSGQASKALQGEEATGAAEADVPVLDDGVMEDSESEDSLPAPATDAQGDTGPVSQTPIELSVPCELIADMEAIPGTFETRLHPPSLVFKVKVNPDAEDFVISAVANAEAVDETPLDALYHRDFVVPFHRISSVQARRYLLRVTAVEVFLVDKGSLFFNFGVADYRRVQAMLSTRKLALYPFPLPLKPSNVTQLWTEGFVTNFDYLMALNTAAGRTYNDISQYPVFPWVLRDYRSDRIDLSDPAVYRDLSYPAGAQRKQVRRQVSMKYRTLAKMQSDFQLPFHFGNHYSSLGAVLFYLLRMEPFTTMAIKLQEGRFDAADRMFRSIPDTWDNVIVNPGDNKELIPEFYYQPEFLKNTNNTMLGTTQDGERVGGVGLPPWATDAEHFVRIHRAALESEYVSQHLHLWIDLIFGVAQTGPQAAERCNVFNSQSYAGAVDIDALKDPAEREAAVSVIANFGQTPHRLFKGPHPAKVPTTKRRARFEVTTMVKKMSVRLPDRPVLVHAIPRASGCAGSGHKLLVVTANGKVGTYRWGQSESGTVMARPLLSMPVKVNDGPISRIITGPGSPLSASAVLLGDTTAPYTLEMGTQGLVRLGQFRNLPGLKERSLNQLFAASPDGRLLYTGGHYDSTLRVHDTHMGDTIQTVSGHRDLVSAVGMSEDGLYLATGSLDTTVLVWRLGDHLQPVLSSRQDAVASSVAGGGVGTMGAPSETRRTGLDPNSEVHPFATLSGHSDYVTSVAVSAKADLVVSGSADGTLILTSLMSGTYIRSIALPAVPTIAVILPDAIVAHCAEACHTYLLHLCTGAIIAECSEPIPVTSIRPIEGGKYLVFCGKRARIAVRDGASLDQVMRLQSSGAVSSAVTSLGEQVIVAGLESPPSLVVYGHD
ncbi:hypothetical protein KIPB_001462 [Kipferlia bialata]|uniref:Uncharacterized protein n=1 Tax=Kipferlia bialata TaxID=797122 RepID=A0A9K3CQQ8_9EUKA|nr:hypothetical protein KIPB_001462 [Kipferlia bialata]|eukprot:g1462.t1